MLNLRFFFDFSFRKEIELESGNTQSYQQNILASQRAHERRLRLLAEQRQQSNTKVAALEAHVRALMQLIVSQGELIEQLKDVLLTPAQQSDESSGTQWVIGATVEVDGVAQQLPEFEKIENQENRIDDDD